MWHGSCLLTFAREEQFRCHRMEWLNFNLLILLGLFCGRSCGQASWRHGTSRAEQPPPSATPRFPTARGGMGKRGLAIQLSQGQGRQPLSPEGAPQAVGVRCSRAAMARVWVRDIVRLASAGVNTLTVTTPAESSPASSLCSILHTTESFPASSSNSRRATKPSNHADLPVGFS